MQKKLLEVNTMIKFSKLQKLNEIHKQNKQKFVYELGDGKLNENNINKLTNKLELKDINDTLLEMKFNIKDQNTLNYLNKKLVDTLIKEGIKFTFDSRIDSFSFQNDEIKKIKNLIYGKSSL